MTVDAGLDSVGLDTFEPLLVDIHSVRCIVLQPYVDVDMGIALLTGVSDPDSLVNNDVIRNEWNHCQDAVYLVQHVFEHLFTLNEGA